MDGVARAVRQAHHQRCQGTLDGQAHRAPAVVLRDGGDHHVIGGELVAEALEAGDDEEIAAVFDRGLRARALLAPPSGDRRTTTLDRAGLHALGRAGGRVVAVRSAGADSVEVDVITPSGAP